MALIRILGKEGLTGSYYVKYGADSRKAVLLTPLKTQDYSNSPAHCCITQRPAPSGESARLIA